MSHIAYGEGPEDWEPNDGSEESVGSDPLCMLGLDERWLTFYIERMIRQVEVVLGAEG